MVGDICLVFIRFLALMLQMGGYPSALKAITIIRAFNSTNLLSHLRMHKAFFELVLVLSTISDCLKTIGYVFSIMFLLVLMASIMFAVGIGQSDYLAQRVDYGQSTWWGMEDYWGSVWQSGMTMFEIITMDQWSSGIVFPLVRAKSWIAFPFLLFLAVT